MAARLIKTVLDLFESDEAIVEDILGGYRLMRRLVALGIVPGARIKVVGKGAMSGPILLEVGHAEVAIGRETAARILVRSVKGEG